MNSQLANLNYWCELVEFISIHHCLRTRNKGVQPRGIETILIYIYLMF